MAWAFLNANMLWHTEGELVLIIPRYGTTWENLTHQGMVQVEGSCSDRVWPILGGPLTFRYVPGH